MTAKETQEKHLIYTYKGMVYQAYKKWTFQHCEKVLERLGASYWEIGLMDDDTQ